MNVQTLKAKLVKGQTDLTKEVEITLGNEPYFIQDVINGPDSVRITVTKKEGLPPGDSIENAKLRKEEEDKSPLEDVTTEQLEEVKEILAEDEVEGQNTEDNE